MKAEMGEQEYRSWQRYWNEEPWGTWRDNLHAAIIGREVRRPQLKRDSVIKLDDFMIVHPDARRKQNKERAFAFLEMMAGPRDGK